MATQNKFNIFTKNVAEKVHNLGADVIKAQLTNTLPLNTNTVIANITDIAAGNGYAAGGASIITTSSTQLSGVYRLILGDTVITASGGAVGPFRYVVLYNSTAASGPLIAWSDYGAAITLNDGESLTIDFDNINGVLTIT